MAFVRPFRCLRPSKEAASRVAALPYDVYSREEAKREAKREPLSFLNIDRPETQFPDNADMYSDAVYEKARELLEKRIADKTFIREEKPCYYLYELTMDGHVQTGIVACASVDDYLSGVIKKHENTREEKELDRIRHVDVTNAQTGPIFLTYRGSEGLKQLAREVKTGNPLYDFVSEDGVRHRVFIIEAEARMQAVTEGFREVQSIYIADGHHRAASAVKVAEKRRREHPKSTGQEEFHFFLSVLFPEEELQILPYNRVVEDLNGFSREEILRALEESFEVRTAGPAGRGYEPGEKGTLGMFLAGEWYELKVRASVRSKDPVKGLDVSILQDWFLDPVLGIQDPRTDKRIKFVGGIRGTEELERMVEDGMAAAFSMYPTSMKELLQAADAGLLMPPKSTWFEPKLRSGLFIHELD